VRNTIILFLAVAIHISGCTREKDATTDDAANLCGAAFALVSGQSTLCIDRSDLSLRLFGPSGEVLATSAAGWIGFGRDENYDEGNNYDPNNWVDGSIPDGWSYDAIKSLVSAETTVNGYTFTVEMTGGRAAELIVEKATVLALPEPLETIGETEPVPGAFTIMLQAEDDADVANVFARIKGQPQENYYGLGEYFDTPVQRGTTRAMHILLSGSESGYNEAHVPIPFFVGTSGWGLFARHDHAGLFDMAASDPEVIGVDFVAKEMVLHLMAAPTPLQVIEQYTALTAKPRVPPVWAFAPQQWRNEVSGQQMVLDDAQAMRDNDLPVGVIWVDRPYQSYYESYTFADNFPDAEGMIDRLNDQGYRVMVWGAPYLSESGAPEFDRFLENGWFVDLPFDLERFTCEDCRMIDLTNPEAQQAWTDQVARITEIGIEGFKLDYAEDINIGLDAGIRLTTQLDNGADERTMHHRYSSYYANAYRNALVDEGFIIARSGAWGGSSKSDCIWPGDLDSEYEIHGEYYDKDDGGTYNAVGGLPAAVAAGISLAASGWPYFASDTGGYRHTRPTHEVMVRWASYAALMPIMQFGGGGVNHNPWDFGDYDDDGEPDFNEQTLEYFNKYARLHIRLFPFFYSYAVRTGETGEPCVRSMGLAFPQESIHSADQYMLGEELLVAPIVTAEGSRDVVFPEGDWINWFDGTTVSGPATENLAVPLGDLLLYQRAGTIVPMLRPEVDTLAPATVTGVDSYANDAGVLWLRIALPIVMSAQFELFDGTNVRAGGSTAITVELEAGETFTSGFRLQLYTTATEVSIDGVPVAAAGSYEELNTCQQGCWAMSEEGAWLEIAVPAGSGEVLVTIQ
jgi:alpha-D-xyloside xylohydrolase